MQKVIVTGASGPLGIMLINECIERSIEVLAVIRPRSANRDNIPIHTLVKVVECDLGDILSLPQLLQEEYDVFFHLGWANTDPSIRKDTAKQSENIIYSIHAARCAKKMGCYAFVGIGSQAEYGIMDGKAYPDSIRKPVTAYGIAKTAACDMLKMECEMLNIRYNWARVFSVYGPYEHTYTMLSYCITTLLKGEKPILTKCEQIWDFMYCKDAVRAILAIGKKGIDGKTYCVSSGESKVLKEFIEITKNAVSSTCEVGIGERPYGEKQIMHLEADITSLKEDTGFECMYDFATGIQETIDWYRSKGE